MEYAAQYDATKIAVINIKDLDGVKNAINVITPDGAKIFQCISASTKNDWINKFEEALKFNQTRNKMKKETKDIKTMLKSEAKAMVKSSTIHSVTSDATAQSPTSTTTSEIESPIVNYGPEWLISAHEEIHTLIAQRHFEEALTLITKCEEYFAKDTIFVNANETTEKVSVDILMHELKLIFNFRFVFYQVKQLKNKLSSVLLVELSNCQTRSLHAALISSRRPLKLLADMKKAREASGALLNVCTFAIRANQRQARRNNLEISQLFFCDLAQVASEFMKAFSQHSACMSSELKITEKDILNCCE